MTNQRGRPARLDPECCVSVDSEAGLAKVLDSETGEYVWARIPKRHFVEHRERLQERRERADGGRRVIPPRRSAGAAPCRDSVVKRGLMLPSP
jgi:hypothetical protein